MPRLQLLGAGPFNRNTIEYLGIWESLYRTNIKGLSNTFQTIPIMKIGYARFSTVSALHLPQTWIYRRTQRAYLRQSP